VLGFSGSFDLGSFGSGSEIFIPENVSIVPAGSETCPDILDSEMWPAILCVPGLSIKSSSTVKESLSSSNTSCFTLIQFDEST
jgi:hypothetical protein